MWSHRREPSRAAWLTDKGLLVHRYAYTQPNTLNCKDYTSPSSTVLVGQPDGIAVPQPLLQDVFGDDEYTEQADEAGFVRQCMERDVDLKFAVVRASSSSKFASCLLGFPTRLVPAQRPSTLHIHGCRCRLLLLFCLLGFSESRTLSALT